MPVVEKAKESLVQPFKSTLLKKPMVSGYRVTKGEWSKPLDDMGYAGWADEKESRERREAFENQIRWDIAHRNHKLLKPCISIAKPYDEATQKLDYMIDLYGDGSVRQEGQLYINRGDYLMFYMRMHSYRRKEFILSQIALANVSVLVPYVRLDDIAFDDPRTRVSTMYRIVL